MVALEKMVPSMFRDIYQTFLADDDPDSTEQDWRRLFFHDWPGQDDHFGYALVDGDSVVGVLGMVFSQRQLGGERVRFCNLHSWYVQEEHRGRSLTLMRPAIALSGHVLTDFSPTERVSAISQRLGFDSLDAKLKILLPARQRDRSGAIEVCDASEALEDILEPADLRLYRDHQHLNCFHLVATNNRQYCYVICSRVSRHWVPYCYLHYVSNREFFSSHNVCMRNELLRRTATRYVAIDARKLAKLRLPRSFTVPMQCRQLVRGTGIEPAQIDTLYSEVLALNLCTLPNVSGRLRQFAQRVGSAVSFRGDS